MSRRRRLLVFGLGTVLTGGLLFGMTYAGVAAAEKDFKARSGRGQSSIRLVGGGPSAIAFQEASRVLPYGVSLGVSLFVPLTFRRLTVSVALGALLELLRGACFDGAWGGPVRKWSPLVVGVIVTFAALPVLFARRRGTIVSLGLPLIFGSYLSIHAWFIFNSFNWMPKTRLADVASDYCLSCARYFGFWLPLFGGWLAVAPPRVRDAEGPRPSS